MSSNNKTIIKTEIEPFQTELGSCYSSEQQNNNLFFLTTNESQRHSIPPSSNVTDWNGLDVKDQPTNELCEDAAPNLSPQVAVHDESELLDLQYDENFW